MTEQAPESDGVAAVVLSVLERHYSRYGWAAKGGIPGTPGRWSCACGARGTVPNGERVVQHHRVHLASVIAGALGTLVGALERAYPSGQAD